jgi:hypothetical protein
MVRNKEKAETIERQLEEFEARLRRQLLREKLDQNVKVNEAFETGALPTIHVSLGALQSSRPAPQYEHASGDWTTPQNYRVRRVLRGFCRVRNYKIRAFI